MNIEKALVKLLRKSYAGVQLSKSRIKALAEGFKGVETEEELEEKLTAFNAVMPLAQIAKDDDRERTLKSELDRLRDNSDEEEPDIEPTPPSNSDEEIPSWAKTLIDTNQALQTQIQTLQAGQVITTRKGKIEAALKGADEKYSAKVLRDFGRMNFKDDEEFEEYLNDVEEDFTSYQEEVAGSKLGGDEPFAGIGGDGKLKDNEVSPMMQSYIEANKPKE